MRQTGQGLAAFQFARLTQDCLQTMWLNNAELRKLMGLKQSVFVPSLVPHLRTSNIKRISQATVLREAAANTCPRLESRTASYLYVNP